MITEYQAIIVGFMLTNTFVFVMSMKILWALQNKRGQDDGKEE